ncbi:MAG: hypothetical protein S4CHLAM6_05560 [Chlamydiae bacterium]|nr:hypothetical protein [Chlamydiota bacterium]
MVTNKTFLINERGPHFWGTHEISKDTQYAKLENGQTEILSKDEFKDALSSLNGKRVLVYIHGLKNTKDDVVKSHADIEENVSALKLNLSLYSRFKSIMKYFLGYSQQEAYSNHQPYDVIIGYSWPSFDNETYYYNAKIHAKKLAPRFAKQLEQISKTTQKVDVLAHSMGNLLLFETLSKHGSPDIKINHIYSIAAAVPHNSLDSQHVYSRVLDYCKNIFVFHSKHDYALGWPYFLAEKAVLALGLVGPLSLSQKIKVVDTSKVIKNHSGYLSSKEFYEYLLKIHNEEFDNEQSHFKMQRCVEV